MKINRSPEPETLVQAQRRYIDTMKSIAGTINKKAAVGARLVLCKWAGRHGYDATVVLNDARDVLELELGAA